MQNDHIGAAGCQAGQYPCTSTILMTCDEDHENENDYVQGVRVRCHGLSDFRVRNRKTTEKIK